MANTLSGMEPFELPPDLFDPENEREGKITVWALAWFPKDEWAKAIQRWPELLDTMPTDHAAYSRKVEAN